MSKVYEIRPTTEKVCTKRTCDLCGHSPHNDRPAQNWGEYNYDYTVDSQTKVSCYIREDGPGGTAFSDVEIDICPRCFWNRLVPWLRSQGAVIQAERTYR